MWPFFVILSQIVLLLGRTPFIGVVLSVWLTWIGLAAHGGVALQAVLQRCAELEVGRRRGLEVELQVVVVVLVGDDPALLGGGVRRGR